MHLRKTIPDNKSPTKSAHEQSRVPRGHLLDQFHLVYAGGILLDGRTLADYIQKESTIRMAMSLLGGMTITTV